MPNTITDLTEKHAPTLVEHFKDLTLDQAKQVVEQLARQHMIRCPLCEGDGILFDGDPASASTPTVPCDRCDGAGRDWPTKWERNRNRR